MATLRVMPCVDSGEMGATRRLELLISRSTARDLGKSALAAAQDGYYKNEQGRQVDWRDLVRAARSDKQSLPPDAALPGSPSPRFEETRLHVVNETTLGASRRLVEAGAKPLSLNFANGIHPGGGFLSGALAQEEVLCRSSALHTTLIDDPMYAAHRERPRPDSTNWAIYSPGTPVFRTDAGVHLDEPWLLDVLTCAAPYAPRLGQPEAGDLLQERIHRVLSIAIAYGYSELVLGAWGCGAFGNDPHRTASDFWDALEGDFSGHFRDVVFAITDWSPERRFLGPFRDCFEEKAAGRSWPTNRPPKMPDQVDIKSRSYWIKVFQSLIQNWALIDEQSDGSACIYFLDDNSGVFDQMTFPSRHAAEDGLIRNEFQRCPKDEDFLRYIPPPEPPFHVGKHSNGPIYSSGRFWK